MVMFTCKWMGCVGGNAERELLLREQPCGLQQIQPAQTSFKSPSEFHSELWSAGKEMASSQNGTALKLCTDSIFALTQYMMRRSPPSGRTAPFDMMSCGCLFGRFRFRTGYFKSAQNLVGGVLQPCVRLVKLTGGLARQRTELVAIFYMRKCLKNEIGTHCLSPFSSNSYTEMSL
jgi:hypothetical protein